MRPQDRLTHSSPRHEREAHPLTSGYDLERELIPVLSTTEPDRPGEHPGVPVELLVNGRRTGLGGRLSSAFGLNNSGNGFVTLPG